MNPKTVKPKPIYFSDHFNVDKAKLKELGVFDPILNFDTKLFVDPILLKSSTSPIFQKARDRYITFFNRILKLLKRSQETDDLFWRAAKTNSKFSEYKYTCIGYGDDSIDGTGPGSSFSDKLLKSAKDIVETAKDDAEMFLLLPLLEDGMGADGISDMTQSIIDEDICCYTKFVMDELGLVGNRLHSSREGNEYLFLKNPYSKTVIKLLPQDILADLPLAETFDGWLVNAAEINETLRKKVNDDIGLQWFKRTKSEKKEALLETLKSDETFFVEVLNVLKESAFEPYDVELDHRGVHRWLKDSEKYSQNLPNTGQINDSLDSLKAFVGILVDHFKTMIEKQGMASLFWADVRGTLKHVNEVYSQMLFFTVSKTWLTATESPVQVSYGKVAETDQLNIRFSISENFTVMVQVKHANNTALYQGFEKNIEWVQKERNIHSIVVVLNFREKESLAMTRIKKTRFEACHLLEISAHLEQPKSQNKNNTSTTEELEAFELDLSGFEDLKFDVPAIDFEDLNWSFDENYTDEKRRGGKQRHALTTAIKEHLIKPLFFNKSLIKGVSVLQRAEKIHEKLSKISTMSAQEIITFSQDFELDLKTLKSAKTYFKVDRSEQVYKWCLLFEKELEK